MNTAIIGMGTNLGDRMDNLKSCGSGLEAIATNKGDRRLSSL